MMQADPALEGHLHQLEEPLLQPNVRKFAAEVSQLLAGEFIEFGSSGRIFAKQQIIASLQMEPTAHRALLDFNTSALAPGVVLWPTAPSAKEGPANRQSSYCAVLFGN
jgi:hypothetical protein